MSGLQMHAAWLKAQPPLHRVTLVIAPTHARFLEIDAIRSNLVEQRHWFASHIVAQSWLDRCDAMGLDLDVRWVVAA